MGGARQKWREKTTKAVGGAKKGRSEFTQVYVCMNPDLRVLKAQGSEDRDKTAIKTRGNADQHGHDPLRIHLMLFLSPFPPVCHSHVLLHPSSLS